MLNRVHRQPFLGHSTRYRQEQARRQRESRDPMMQALYDSQAWQVLRLQVLAESNGVCAVARCLVRATVVDHKIPHRGAHDLFFDRANLQALCKPHHDRKTVQHDGGFGRRPRGSAP